MENKDNIGANPDPLKKDLGVEVNTNEDMRDEANGLLQNIKDFLRDLLDIREDTDRSTTVEAIRKDIPFKGHNAWILIFSIFVASIGLNVSSTAVVIGAMLISPLMGPIVGVGLSIAINDAIMMKRSFVNLAVMIVLSVLTATIYFSLSPVKEVTPELMARTWPTILDVFIAIFGGLALIVAKTKSGTIASVIFGVAIATALMPPLCTVGYGLSQSIIGNSEGLYWALGALYLFSINAVFIALATFTVSKLLKFPLVKYANQKTRKRTTRMATLIAILVLVPSVWTFLRLLNQQIFITRAKAFVTNTIKYEGAEIVKETDDAEKKRIDIYLIGNLVPQNIIAQWEDAFKKTEDCENCILVVHQGADQSGELAARLSTEVRSGILEDLYVKNQEAMSSKDEQIRLLENEVTQLRGAALPFSSMRNEAKINYDGLKRFGYATEITTDFSGSVDTLTVVRVLWADSLSQDIRDRQQRKMGLWIKERFSLDTVVVSGNLSKRK